MHQIINFTTESCVFLQNVCSDHEFYYKINIPINRTIFCRQPTVITVISVLNSLCGFDVACCTVRGTSEAALHSNTCLGGYGRNTDVGVTVRNVKTCGTTKETSNSSLNMRTGEPQMNHKQWHSNQKGTKLYKYKTGH